MTAPLTRTAKLVAGAFTVSGIVHLVRPQVFEPTMPAWVPAHRDVIVYSGVAELLCAAGLAWPRTRRAAGLASAALLVGVFPANAQMASDALRTDNTALKVATLARLPLQVPMIRAALGAARGA
ncbi:DoxX family protein [Nocardioides sambongensis]|uniref:DoxX family protein n=1 Tax=Nocardioides sambongensis TaxID=2589074 RepID=UPI00112A76D5|nr:DoxX family protein [Nocardioides sambongensis]